jgi:hypothetical protein
VDHGVLSYENSSIERFCNLNILKSCYFITQLYHTTNMEILQFDVLFRCARRIRIQKGLVANIPGAIKSASPLLERVDEIPGQPTPKP